MTKTETKHEQSMDLEYDDFISSLQNSDSMTELAAEDSLQDDDEPVEELKRQDDSDDYSDFSQDDNDEEVVGIMEEPSWLALQNDDVVLDTVCDSFCQESMILAADELGDCSNLNTLLESISDTLGYNEDIQLSLPTERTLPLSRPGVDPGESAPDRETSSTESSSTNSDSLENKETSNSVRPMLMVAPPENDDIEYTHRDMQNTVLVLDPMQEVTTPEYLPTCSTPADLIPNIPVDEAISTTSAQPLADEITTNSTRETVDTTTNPNEVIGEGQERDRPNETTAESVRSSHGSHQSDGPKDELVDTTTPTENPKDFLVETSFLSTTVLDESNVSDCDWGGCSSVSIESAIVPENKKKKRKVTCFLVGNCFLFIGVIVMSTMIVTSVMERKTAAGRANAATIPSFPTSNNSNNNSNNNSTKHSSPSHRPTNLPTVAPTRSLAPSILPSIAPSTPLPSSSPTDIGESETTFYAIGDVPYNNLEKTRLRDRMIGLKKPSPQSNSTGGEFLIHLGDIRSGQDKVTPCRLEEYTEVRDILLQSEIPVFIIPGDNEWNDCPNPVEGKSFWRQTFHEFDKHWNHTFQVERHPLQPENFYFVHKRTLYFGLNLVGGRILNMSSYSMQLEGHAAFVKSMIDYHVVLSGDASAVVVFGHAFPVAIHDAFFVPLRQYINEQLEDNVPILYLNGDFHKFDFQQNYLSLQNLQRLQVDFGTVNPPLKVTVSPSSRPDWNATDTFAYDRMLSSR